jgi:hypothetical protein
MLIFGTILVLKAIPFGTLCLEIKKTKRETTLSVLFISQNYLTHGKNISYRAFSKDAKIQNTSSESLFSLRSSPRIHERLRTLSYLFQRISK